MMIAKNFIRFLNINNIYNNYLRLKMKIIDIDNTVHTYNTDGVGIGSPTLANRLTSALFMFTDLKDVTHTYSSESAPGTGLFLGSGGYFTDKRRLQVRKYD